MRGTNIQCYAKLFSKVCHRSQTYNISNILFMFKPTVLYNYNTISIKAQCSTIWILYLSYSFLTASCDGHRHASGLMSIRKGTSRLNPLHYPTHVITEEEKPIHLPWMSRAYYLSTSVIRLEDKSCFSASVSASFCICTVRVCVCVRGCVCVCIRLYVLLSAEAWHQIWQQQHTSI